MKIAEVPSGTIEIVRRKAGLVVEFNCSCQDALPFCQAICCGMRSVYTSQLTEIEIAANKFQTTEIGGMLRLAADPSDDKCVYLDKEKLSCKVHADKPTDCQRWHCSPGGVGDGVSVRGGGWMLLPIMPEQAKSL